MDETRERFLLAIVARLGAERIVELHLFSPLRQGVLETGVAVVAVLPDLSGAASEPQVAFDAGVADELVVDAVVVDEADIGESEDHVADALDAPDVPDAPDHLPEPSPYLDADAALAEETVVGIETPAESRHVVFTARYRLTRKGPDRGKWFFEVVAQADAPLATVDTVVRGVTRRSKDLTESERLSGEQLRALLAEPAWRTAP